MSMVKQLIGQVRARVNFTTIKCIMSQGSILLLLPGTVQQLVRSLQDGVQC